MKSPVVGSRMFAAVMAVGVILFGVAADLPQPESTQRDKAEKLQRNGNYKDAYQIYEKLALDKDSNPILVGNDLNNAVSCLQSLNRVNEADALLEKAVSVHKDSWRVLYSAAHKYFELEHQGYIVAGNFSRGQHRGGGEYVNSVERDRVRALQLLRQAIDKSADEPLKGEVAGVYHFFAQVLMGYREYTEAWRLQYLSDLVTLPDYDQGWYRYDHMSAARGAPVDKDGKPVFHAVPASYESAQSDGERWRWLLKRSVELDPNRENETLMEYADFLKNQFGVQTMSTYGGWFGGVEDNDDKDGKKKDESGTYALHTLADNETIAKLANGIKRFTLPEDADFIKIYRKIADAGKSAHGEYSLDRLAQTYQDRRQYDKAAEYWQRDIKEYRPGAGDWKKKALDQILGNWGRFENEMTHPAGEEAAVQFKFRNGKKVSFEAYQIKVAELLSDLKDYLKSNPRELDWNRMNLGNIGYMLVEKDQKKYIGEKVSEWNLKLDPRPSHFDRRITVKTPLKKAGAYLLVAKMEDGNTSRIIVWLDDTVIVKKPTKNGTFVFVADAVTGQPLPKVNVEFFGYQHKWLEGWLKLGRQYDVITTAFADNTDENGQIIVPQRHNKDGGFQWLLSATTAEGRLAFLGFSSIWGGDYYDSEYNMQKVFGITDRPVYRPDQKVKFKFWIREAKYDQENVSAFGNQDFAVIITNPKGDKVLEKTFKTDAYGGLNGELALPKDAMLGQYYAYVWQQGRSHGGAHFRVEEYKKPEFEVTVEAPKEPVMLGEKITATIMAKYYFGAPVAKGKVKYKVLRSDYAANWHPYGPWDWLYGRGYWWFACDYNWYPGWRDWGCKRPMRWWWPAANNPPEVIAETEAPISPDGIMKVEIDTAIAKEMHSDTDHRYEITAEVTDESRRTIVGQGAVLVARKPFKVYAWADRGHYKVGDPILMEVSAQTLDRKPVKGAGEMTLYKIAYKKTDGLNKKDVQVDEKKVQDWVLNTGEEGKGRLQIKASEPGQYRVSYKVTDEKKHTIEGGQVFCVMGEGFDGKQFRFNEIELIPQEKEYSPNEKVKLMINVDRPDSTVVLFVRPANGVYLQPKIIRLKGKSTVEEIEITKKDMPNFFVEAFTISGGKYFDEVKEIIVPPEKRVLNVEVKPSSDKYKPGEMASVKVKVTDVEGKPFAGSTVVSCYDKSVDYIAGGSNVPEIKEFFWKWRRSHYPTSEHSLNKMCWNLLKTGELTLQGLGVFGEMVADEAEGFDDDGMVSSRNEVNGGGGPGRPLKSNVKRKMLGGKGSPTGMTRESAAPTAAVAMDAVESKAEDRASYKVDREASADALVEATVRSEFADTAFWAASLATDEKGEAEVEFKMPENLTGWKIKSWAMGHGTVVGEGSVEVVTVKNLLLRLQSPRFFVEKDEVVLSANIHNYLKSAKKVKAMLELEGGCIEVIGDASQNVEIAAGEEKRVDWRVKVVKEGQAVVRMKALSDEESDAMQMKFPVYVHGMLKTDSFCGVIRREEQSQKLTINVPAERRAEQSVLEVRYSPTLAGAMVDALPYLVEYPYGCTEQTLNKFLPTVMTQKILKDMGLNLKAVAEKRTNLNAQEIGDDKKRAEDWKRLAGDQRWDGEKWVARNPVFDEAEVRDMVREGLRALTAMQLSDGGWGWFSGWGEHSYPHTTAYVVHGLQMAQQNGVGLVPGVLDRGVQWLVAYQAEELAKLKNPEKEPWKTSADNMDAFVYMVLTDAGKENKEMRDFLYRDRTKLAVYAKAMFGLALQKVGDKEKLDMVMQNIDQFLVMDKENQTAYLNLGNEGYWWCWYGSEYEAQAYYLKLLSVTDPKGDKAAWLVKYLLNNRRHASYWNSTRDTAVCIEAMADFIRASKEDKPDMTVEIYVDGKKVKEVKIDAGNIFSFDNKLIMAGDAVTAGEHTVEVRRKGEGPVYFNAYMTNFTLEDNIKKAGLEIKVNRKYYKLNKLNKKIKVAGDMGQALDQKVEKYERAELANLAKLKSGDLVEIELEIDSKNDYEYILFEDMKAAGFEPVDVRSGYNNNSLGAYMEFRDERVCMFVRQLARGKHSVSYRVRAEIPGLFSALPTKASAMYAPELKANSDEIKLGIED